MFLVIGGLIAAVALFGRPRTLGRELRFEKAAPTIALIIPARNEDASLGNLLADIAVQTLRPGLVMVVDDHSTDNTRAIAAAVPDVVVIDAPALPPGWNGKPWACQIGAEAAIQRCGPDTLLVFLDADVRLHPDALEALAGQAAAGGVVSVQPFHDVPAGVEQLSAMFNLVSLMGVGAGTDHPSAIFGPVICCTAADYRAIDGHRSVASAIAEDVELGHRFLAAGVAIRVVTGGSLVRFRMYPTGLRSMIEGWSKNMATGAASIALWRTLAVGWWIAALVIASTQYVSAVGSVVLRGDLPAWDASFVVVASGAVLGLLLAKVGSFRSWIVALYPVLVAFFVTVFVRSVWLTHVRRSVTWRGRTIDLTDDLARRSAGIRTGPGAERRWEQ